MKLYKNLFLLIVLSFSLNKPSHALVEWVLPSLFVCCFYSASHNIAQPTNLDQPWYKRMLHETDLKSNENNLNSYTNTPFQFITKLPREAYADAMLLKSKMEDYLYSNKK